MENKITVNATIEAPMSKVWDYYTNPKHIVNWNFADTSWHCPTASNDMKVGGIYNARMEARDNSFGFNFEAVYVEILEGESFVYQFGDRQATVQLSDQNGHTKLTIVFDPETQNSIELQQQGWQAILNNFKNYTESN